MDTTSSKKSVFVTGAAGFIGMHVALALKRRGDSVLGLDHFNAYYDPQLKRQRAALLKEEGIDVVEASISDRDLLSSLFTSHSITHCVHLAAQAGVRHSLEAPEDYVSSNLQGFTSVLEACRKKGSIQLVYASSSSVYGLNRKIPFSVEDPTDHPANFYGATKKANEVMAHAYHHLYGFPVTGLRYFTVYGPWGRPDMAYFRFAEKILNKEPIPLFGGGKMRRDFTYIDDIVQGTIAALDFGSPCALFNLGNHRPVETLYLVSLLEKELGQKAILHHLPVQPGEVFETFADIDKSRECLGYTPKVSLEEGIGRFVHWYLDHKSRSTSGMDSKRSVAIIP